MEFILYVIIGSLTGSLIVLITINLFNSKPSVDYQELIRQSEERLEILKKHGEELDKMLEEMKKQSGGGIGRRIDSVKLAENEVTNMNEWFKCNNEQPTEITGSNPVLTTSV